MKLSKKDLRNILETYDFEDLYKFFLNNFSIYKSFDGTFKRQIFFDIGKLGQICFEKEGGEVLRYTIKEGYCFDLSKYPNKEYPFLII